MAEEKISGAFADNVSAGDVRKQGNLTKLGGGEGGTKSWKKRFFVLTDHLAYYENERVSALFPGWLLSSIQTRVRYGWALAGGAAYLQNSITTPASSLPAGGGRRGRPLFLFPGARKRPEAAAPPPTYRESSSA